MNIYRTRMTILPLTELVVLALLPQNLVQSTDGSLSSISFTTNANCTNYPDWKDASGNGCEWYENNDDPECPSYGNQTIGSNNLTAIDSCCYCSLQIPEGATATPTAQTTASATSNNTTYNEYCVDSLWYSGAALDDTYTSEPESYGLVSCAGFTSQSLCEIYGDWDFAVYDDPLAESLEDLTYAKDSCCACGGGKVSNDPCYDNPSFRTFTNKTCSYFTSDPRVVLQSFEIGQCAEVELSSLNLIGIDAAMDTYYAASIDCCVCGGGRIEPYPTSLPTLQPESSFWPGIPSNISGFYEPLDDCVDIRHWQDPFATGCDWWRLPLGEHLQNFPDLFLFDENYELLYTPVMHISSLEFQAINNGYRPTLACCWGQDLKLRGGGVNISQSISTVESHEIDCVDFPGFRALGQNCTSINIESENSFICSAYGDIIGEKGTSFKESCCICNGGYSGINIARQMKGFVGSDLDSWYTLRTNLDGSRDGSLYNFTRTIASSMNIGIYEAELNYINTFNLSNPASDIDLCMAEMSVGEKDICVGAHWNVTNYGLYSSETLFVDHFHLVVPLKDLNFFSLLLTPFRPFSPRAWVAIAAVTFYMTFTLQVIQKSDRYRSKKSFVRRIGSIMYNSTITCSGSMSVSDSPSTSEKIVIAMIALFVLVMVAAYTASTAAFLVQGVPLKYQSINDATKASDTKICLNYKLVDTFIDKFPNAAPNTVSVTSRVSDMLEMIDGGECDVAVVHKDAFDEAIANDASLCKRKALLVDDVIMSINNVLFAASNTKDLSIDFLNYVNRLIKAGIYDDIHSHYRDQFVARTGNRDTCEMTNDDLDNSGTSQLTELNLFSPLTIPVTLTTVILILHCFQPLKLRTKRYFGFYIQENDEDYLLIERIRNMKAFDMISELKKLGVEKQILVGAMAKLPDKSELGKLLFSFKCTSDTQTRKVVEKSLSLFELHELCEYCHEQGYLVYSRNILDDTSNKLTSILTNKLFQSEKSRFVATTAARMKNEDHSSQFDVEEFLRGHVNEETNESNLNEIIKPSSGLNYYSRIARRAQARKENNI